jgi:DNA-binding transcriptional MerR regulator
VITMLPTEDRQEISYLRTGQVAEILGITKKTLKNWLKAQFIPEPVRHPVNQYRRWTLQDVESIRRILSDRQGTR